MLAPKRWGPITVATVAVAWALWLGWGGRHAVAAVADHWKVSLTMVFGSLVGGGTSEGGGAVSFPVFTKVLHVPAPQARLFTFMIQSVGMSCASIGLLVCRRRMITKAIYLGGPAGAAGAVLGILYIAPHVAPPTVRVLFSAVLVSLAMALGICSLRRIPHNRLTVGRWGVWTYGVVVLAGFAGGLVSGVVGVGENIAIFALLVLLFRVSETVVTPTSVVVMSMVSLTAAGMHLFVVRDVPPVVVNYWLAAVPVVVVGAPVGALIASRMSGVLIRTVLITLITADAISTVVLVPISGKLWLEVVLVLTVTIVLCLALVLVGSRLDRPEIIPAARRTKLRSRAFPAPDHPGQRLDGIGRLTDLGTGSQRH